MVGGIDDGKGVIVALYRVQALKLAKQLLHLFGYASRLVDAAVGLDAPKDVALRVADGIQVVHAVYLFQRMQALQPLAGLFGDALRLVHATVTLDAPYHKAVYIGNGVQIGVVVEG